MAAALVAAAQPLLSRVSCGGVTCGGDLVTEIDLCNSGDVGVDLAPGFEHPSRNCRARNLVTARAVIRQTFAELEAQCREEQEQYRRSNTAPSLQKRNRWTLYTSAAGIRRCREQSLDFARWNPEFRARVLPAAYIRFLVLLQHSLTEDVLDVYRPESARRHCDTFEGFTIDGSVNSQLIKDAHRSEWTVEGRSFTMSQASGGNPDTPSKPADMSNPDKCTDGKAHTPSKSTPFDVALKDGAGSPATSSADQGRKSGDPNDNHYGAASGKKAILDFQRTFVSVLELFLLGYCDRRGLSPQGTQRLLRVITTQMSQCGLANLDRSSQAAKYYVMGQGLQQRTAYNISTMDAGPQHGEALKLSMYCMKTGFSQYHTEESLGMTAGAGASAAFTDMDDDDNHESESTGPMRCSPRSFLYQYATLRFLPIDPTQAVDADSRQGRGALTTTGATAAAWFASSGVLNGLGAWSGVSAGGPSAFGDDAAGSEVERVDCVVIDALDEVCILPPDPPSGPPGWL